MLLVDTVTSLRECEYYFRRFPFRDLPVTRNAHITNVCEMYFGRFYEFKERLKFFFDALKVVAPDHHLAVGVFIRAYEKAFDQELRERHGVHHRNRFTDVAIHRVSVMGIFSKDKDEVDWQAQQDHAYRKFTREWVLRVRKRANDVDYFLEAVAQAALQTCSFLQDKK